MNYDKLILPNNQPFSKFSIPDKYFNFHVYFTILKLSK